MAEYIITGDTPEFTISPACYDTTITSMNFDDYYGTGPMNITIKSDDNQFPAHLGFSKCEKIEGGTILNEDFTYFMYPISPKDSSITTGLLRSFTSRVPNMRKADHAFEKTSLTAMPENIDYTKLESAYMMFDSTHITGASDIHFDSLVSAEDMFDGSDLMDGDLYFPKATDCNAMFYDCTNLRSLAISIPAVKHNLSDTSKNGEGNMFKNCSKLSELIMPEPPVDKEVVLDLTDLPSQANSRGFIRDYAQYYRMSGYATGECSFLFSYATLRGEVTGAEGSIAYAPVSNDMDVVTGNGFTIIGYPYKFYRVDNKEEVTDEAILSVLKKIDFMAEMQTGNPLSSTVNVWTDGDGNKVYDLNELPYYSGTTADTAITAYTDIKFIDGEWTGVIYNNPSAYDCTLNRIDEVKDSVSSTTAYYTSAYSSTSYYKPTGIWNAINGTPESATVANYSGLTGFSADTVPVSSETDATYNASFTGQDGWVMSVTNWELSSTSYSDYGFPTKNIPEDLIPKDGDVKDGELLSIDDYPTNPSSQFKTESSFTFSNQMEKTGVLSNTVVSGIADIESIMNAPDSAIEAPSVESAVCSWENSYLSGVEYTSLEITGCSYNGNVECVLYGEYPVDSFSADTCIDVSAQFQYQTLTLSGDDNGYSLGMTYHGSAVTVGSALTVTMDDGITSADCLVISINETTNTFECTTNDFFFKDEDNKWIQAVQDAQFKYKGEYYRLVETDGMNAQSVNHYYNDSQLKIGDTFLYSPQYGIPYSAVVVSEHIDDMHYTYLDISAVTPIVKIDGDYEQLFLGESVSNVVSCGNKSVECRVTSISGNGVHITGYTVYDETGLSIPISWEIDDSDSGNVGTFSYENEDMTLEVGFDNTETLYATPAPTSMDIQDSVQYIDESGMSDNIDYENKSVLFSSVLNNAPTAVTLYATDDFAVYTREVSANANYADYQWEMTSDYVSGDTGETETSETITRTVESAYTGDDIYVKGEEKIDDFSVIAFVDSTKYPQSGVPDDSLALMREYNLYPEV